MLPEWEIWLDTNISPIIAKWMAEHLGMTVKSSYSLSLHFLTDREIYDRAKDRQQVIIVSKDSDFSQLVNRLGAPPKLINLKIGNCDNRVLWAKLKPGIAQATRLLMTTDLEIIDFEA